MIGPRFKAKKSLKFKREKIGLKQADMAQIVGELAGSKMSHSKYQKIELGRMEATLNEAIAICKMFPDVQILELWNHVRDVEKA